MLISMIDHIFYLLEQKNSIRLKKLLFMEFDIIVLMKKIIRLEWYYVVYIIYSAYCDFYIFFNYKKELIT